MRLGVVWVPVDNAHYRAIDPLNTMAMRGHHVVWPPDGGAADLTRLEGCDVVHVFRRADLQTQRVLEKLSRQGTAFTYDNDDDFTAIPEESPRHKEVGALAGQQIFADTARIARSAHCFTTTNDVLAAKYRQAQVESVEVISNYLATTLDRTGIGHEGVVIGWVGTSDDRVDLKRIPVVEALRRLLDEHPEVRVESIGIDLGLRERYRYDATVDFREIPARIADWDIGIAPLADIPYNVTRTDIRLKEYAGSGVPWLASPVGPYRDLGAAEGGRKVPDGGWFEALDLLVRRPRDRRRLARRARKWAKRQSIDTVADRWLSVFTAAAEARRGAPAAFRAKALARPRPRRAGRR